MEKIKVILAPGAENPFLNATRSLGYDFKINSFIKVCKGKVSRAAEEININSQKRGEFTLRPFERILVGTGVSIVLPRDKMLCLTTKQETASSLGIMVMDSPKIIDFNHTEEICVILYNTCQFLTKIKIGDKIARGYFTAYQPVEFEN